uniref:Exostosin domain-containing protein n=1 Tax=Panagrellus redivivus TaxID=6233 RepID=A0A7E4VAL4_PANRE
MKIVYENRRTLNRLLVYLLAGCLSLFVIHGVTLQKNKSVVADDRSPPPPISPIETVETHDMKIVHVEKNDTNADHCVFYDFLRRSDKEVTEYEPLTLALHSSINYAEYLVRQTEEWDDVISYAIYLFPGHDAGLAPLAKLHKCHALINQKVSIHLVWNRNFIEERPKVP